MTLRNHLLVAGTGRSGTSFLIRYLTALGMDTHLARGGAVAQWFEEAQAGFEDMPLIHPPTLPHVIKSPWSFEFIDELLAHDTIRIEGAILPVRDIREVAASRAMQERREIHERADWMTARSAVWESWGYTPGGIMFSLSPVDQARLLAVGFHQLVERLVAHDVPILFVGFPRAVAEPDHLFRSLRTILPAGITEEAARAAHATVADPSLVRAGDRTRAATSLAGPSDAEMDRRALQLELRRTRAMLAERDAELSRRPVETPQATSPPSPGRRDRLRALLRLRQG